MFAIAQAQAAAMGAEQVVFVGTFEPGGVAIGRAGADFVLFTSTYSI